MSVLNTLLAVMVMLAPRGEHWALASANEKALRHQAPLFDHDADFSQTGSLLVAIQDRESGLRNIPGDCPGLRPGASECDAEHATSFGPMQIHEAAARLYSVDEHVSRGLERVRASLKACAHLPVEWRLANYARGDCESAEGQRISRDRFAHAKWIRSKWLALQGGRT